MEVQIWMYICIYIYMCVCVHITIALKPVESQRCGAHSEVTPTTVARVRRFVWQYSASDLIWLFLQTWGCLKRGLGLRERGWGLTYGKCGLDLSDN